MIRRHSQNIRPPVKPPSLLALRLQEAVAADKARKTNEPITKGE
jgi:hypothetical protein